MECFCEDSSLLPLFVYLFMHSLVSVSMGSGKSFYNLDYMWILDYWLRLFPLWLWGVLSDWLPCSPLFGALLFFYGSVICSMLIVYFPFPTLYQHANTIWYNIVCKYYCKHGNLIFGIKKNEKLHLLHKKVHLRNLVVHQVITHLHISKTEFISLTSENDHGNQLQKTYVELRPLNHK